MKRSQRSGLNPVIIIGIVVLIVVFGAGAWHFIGAADPYRTVPAIDVESYMTNANSLRGNTCKLDGEIMNSLAWSPAAGRLVAVCVEGGKKALPVILPVDFNSINIQKGQKYQFLLIVDDKGLLRVKKLTKA